MAGTDEIETPIKPTQTSMIKIIAVVILVILLLICSVVGTLYYTGFLSKKPSHESTTTQGKLDEQQAPIRKIPKEIIQDDGPLNETEGSSASTPTRVQKKSPEFVRFQYTYKQMEKELLSNLTGTRKVIMIQVAFMTSYDDRVFKNIDKHEFAIRGALLDEMRKYTETDTLQPEFRKELADKLKDATNAVLEKYEDFGGVDAVHFTSFIIQ